LNVVNIIKISDWHKQLQLCLMQLIFFKTELLS
jgi:hypothetical protein